MALPNPSEKKGGSAGRASATGPWLDFIGRGLQASTRPGPPGPPPQPSSRIPAGKGKVDASAPVVEGGSVRMAVHASAPVMEGGTKGQDADTRCNELSINEKRISRQSRSRQNQLMQPILKFLLRGGESTVKCSCVSARPSDPWLMQHANPKSARSAGP